MSGYKVGDELVVKGHVEPGVHAFDVGQRVVVDDVGSGGSIGCVAVDGPLVGLRQWLLAVEVEPVKAPPRRLRDRVRGWLT